MKQEATTISPEENLVNQEELKELAEDAINKVNLLINLVFYRKELFDAWYAKNIEHQPLITIAAAQHISRYQAKKRVLTAEEIIYSLRKRLHEIDDRN